MLNVAVILEDDEIRLIVVRPSPEALIHELARYAAEHASFQLSSDDEARFTALLGEGRERQAVDLYFRRGGRWAPERLVERTVRLPEGVPRPAGSCFDTPS